MAKKQNFRLMATEILENLGGKENLANVNHCATRLRVVVNDSSKVNSNTLKRIDGVLAVEQNNDEIQVIVGQIIEDLFIEVEKLVGNTSGNSSSNSSKKNIITMFSSFLQLMAGIMSPVIPSLIAAGFLTCLLLLLNLVFGIDSTNPTYIILNNLAQAVFYFLPVFVAYTSARKFNTEPVLAMLLACWLLFPDWVAMASEGGYTSYFGIPTLLTTYDGAVVQIILSVWVMSKFDVLLKKILPISVRHFLKPFLLILTTSVITLTLTGPLGGLVTNYIASFINFVRTNASWATVPAIVIFSMTVGLLAPGFHLALIPIATTSLATVGYDDVINIWFYCCTIVPGFIALAVGLKTKNKNLKEIAFPASLSALFGGISEPEVYGISYRMPKVYLCSFAASTITAFYAGIVHLKCYGFGGYSLTNILLYLGENGDTQNFIKALIGVGIMAVCSFVFVFMTKWDDSIYNDESNEVDSNITNSTRLFAPAKGKFIAQSEINDQVFSKGVVGECFGIKPISNKIYAPITGTINSIASTNHAITIIGASGEEVMVHIGLDTMKIDSKDIIIDIAVGQKVKAGDSIATVDLKAFKEKEIDDIIIVILLNSNRYSQITTDSENAILLAEV